MWKIVGAMGLVLLVIAGGFYWYFDRTQTTIANLNQEKAVLELSVDTQIETIESMEDDMKRINEQLVIINTELSRARIQNRELVDRLGRHEIGALARARPGLVENIINNATAQAGRCFELLSGAPLNEREQNAENARAFNSECPWLYDDLIGR